MSRRVLSGRREVVVVAAAVPLALVGIALLAAGLGGWVSWLEGGATLLGGFIVGLVGIGLATWLIPRAQAARLRAAGITDPIKLAELTNAARTTITQAAAGIGLILTLALTAYQVNETRRSSDANLRIAEQGQVTERFSRAVEQLGATTSDGKPAVDIRIGALFSLLRIGLDSERDTLPALLVATQYVKNNHERPETKPRGHGCFGGPPRLRPDVAAALEHVIPPLAAKVGPTGTSGRYYARLEDIDFGNSDLRGVEFRNVWLEDVSFRNSNLTGVPFRGVELIQVDFVNACLNGADLRQTRGFENDVRGASFRDAKLSPEIRAEARAPSRRPSAGPDEPSDG